MNISIEEGTMAMPTMPRITTEVIDEAADDIASELQRQCTLSVSIRDNRHLPSDARARHAARAAVIANLLDHMDEPGFRPTPREVRKYEKGHPLV